MPITLPKIDDRRYQGLVDEALARIPVYTPEWTNFNRSDPGVTLIEVFAFLTESLLYRSNQIPERNRLRFLQLLGLPLQEGSSAAGLATFDNERGPFETITLNAGLELRAGQLPFRTTLGLDMLPIEARLFYKRSVQGQAEQVRNYYKQLYASLLEAAPGTEPALYETTPFPPREGGGVDLGKDAIDGSLWIALLARSPEEVKAAPDKIGGKTLSLGIVPSLETEDRVLAPGNRNNPEAASLLRYEMPVGETLTSGRAPNYKSLETSATADVLSQPGIVQIKLPPASELKLLDNLDPLDEGTGQFPPSLDDTRLKDRLITWVRVSGTTKMRFRLLWTGINATTITQRTEVFNEALPDGTGAPDQKVVLAKTPVIPDSIRLMVAGEEWKEIKDLTAAGAEVPAPDARLQPGAPQPKNERVKVFRINLESGEVFFGDGIHGARPPFEAAIRADYAYGAGSAGNVNAGAINTSPALPAGLKVTNPIATWGGADAETVSEGEKHIARYLQHRDRLVTTVDFKTIARRTPGVDIGRIEVIPAWSPELNDSEPGDAPGAVTLMLIPRYDPKHPNAPEPDRIFLNAVCDYLDERRLVTTEVFLRGPRYRKLWVSVGIVVDAGRSIAEVTQAVKDDLLKFLSPLPQSPAALCDAPESNASDATVEKHCGWPLRKAVNALELMARASRNTGVTFVNDLLLAEDTAEATTAPIELRGLDLPSVAGISVTVGEPLLLDQLRGTTGSQAGGVEGGAGAQLMLPVPVIPDECR